MRINKHTDKASSGDDGAAAPSGTPVSRWPVSRWIDRQPGGTTLQDRAAALFRAAPVPSPLGRQVRERVGARVSEGLAVTGANARARRGGRLRPASLHWAIAGGLLLGSGAVIAARGVDRWWSAPATIAPANTDEGSGEGSDKASRSRRSHRDSRPRGAASEPSHGPEGAPDSTQTSPNSTAEAPAATTVALASPAMASEGGDAAPRTPRTAGEGRLGESRLATEARLLNAAISRLRQRNDAAGALVRLEEYLQRFPRGTLMAEASIARVDALLVLGRRSEALAALERLALNGDGREQELKVIRGELRAPAECGRAIADFDAILAANAGPQLAERALYGRAVCQLRAGRPAEAERDAQLYLARFPGGRFAATAERLRRSVGANTASIRVPPPRPLEP